MEGKSKKYFGPEEELAKKKKLTNLKEKLKENTGKKNKRVQPTPRTPLRFVIKSRKRKGMKKKNNGRPGGEVTVVFLLARRDLVPTKTSTENPEEGPRERAERVL